MAAPTILDIETILEASKIAGGYACIDRAKKNALYGGFVEQLLPEKIQFVRKRVQNRYDKTPIAANAQGAITITTLPANQYNIQVFVNDPDNGNISLGSYTKDGTDTTTTLLATHIATALAANAYGYNISTSLNSVIITARTGLGSTINGDNLSVSATTTAEVKAKAFFGFPTRVSTGTVYTTTAVDPTLGTITLSVYTQQAGDTTDDIFNTNFLASLNANAYGYTTTLYFTTGFYIVAPTGYGASINGNNATIARGPSSQLADFLGGVYEKGIIPNYLTQFSGGVSATQDTSLRDTANLLWSLLGKYGIRALNNLFGGGTVIHYSNDGVNVNVSWDKAQFIIGDPSQSITAEAVTPTAGATSVTFPYKILPKTEFITYQGIPVPLSPEGDFSVIPSYDANSTTYTFSSQLTEGYALNFQFAKIISMGGGTVVNFTNNGLVVNVSWDRAQFVIGNPSQSITAGATTPSDGDNSIIFPFQIMPKSELITYQGVPVPLSPDDGGGFTPSYDANSTTYAFTNSLTDGYSLNFQFARIVSTGSGGAVQTPNGSVGLQSLPLTVATTSDTLVVTQLGTFVFALINGVPYANDAAYITQTGNVLDASNIGGWTAGQNVIIFYNP